MMKQLAPGLSIKFGRDGTWLNFDPENGGKRGSINLENLASSICKDALANWREEYLARFCSRCEQETTKDEAEGCEDMACPFLTP